MDEEIKQIIPVQNVYAVYEDNNERIVSPVKCIALTDKGNVKLLDVDSLGDFSFVGETSNFAYLYFSDIDEVERKVQSNEQGL